MMDRDQQVVVGAFLFSLSVLAWAAAFYLVRLALVTQ
jgi:hypothetical protein